jgi:hypothetical protein
MATITTTKQHGGTLFGFPVWSWVAIAVIFAITATVLVGALNREAPVDPAAEQAIAAEREAAIERSIAAATERQEGLAEYYAAEREAAIERSIVAATERLTAQAWAYVLANPDSAADVSRLPVPVDQSP